MKPLAVKPVSIALAFTIMAGCTLPTNLVNSLFPNKPLREAAESPAVEAEQPVSEELPAPPSSLSETPDINPLVGASSLDSDDEVSGASVSATGKTSLSGAKVVPNWSFQSAPYIYDYVTDGQPVALEYQTLSGGPVYAYMFYYQKNKAGKWQWQNWGPVYEPKRHGFYKNSIFLGGGTRMILFFFLSTKGGTVNASLGSAENRPVPPGDLKASHISPNSFVLTWRHVAGASNYKVYKDGVVLFPNTATNSYNVKDLTPNRTYRMEVSTINSKTEESDKAPLNVATAALSSGGSEMTTLIRRTLLSDRLAKGQSKQYRFEIYPSCAGHKVKIDAQSGDIQVRSNNPEFYKGGGIDFSNSEFSDECPRNSRCASGLNLFTTGLFQSAVVKYQSNGPFYYYFTITAQSDSQYDLNVGRHYIDYSPSCEF